MRVVLDLDRTRIQNPGSVALDPARTLIKNLVRVVLDRTLILNPVKLALDLVQIRTAAPNPSQIHIRKRANINPIKSQAMVPARVMVVNPRKIA
jgi:hypothetical protein